ncbi:hypothetical protein EDD66_10847 [Mobilisporobacter senegalensis]|uniref:Lipoprotein n=1 Tax=Mobilisporobacter senegalensis TaxID=1329262 RepID=A0A3N1XI37_9FIRM|nr:hypothetical protein [Mobilisporobacter senegalensis]ROR26325.1 hypothetical protein EDD66_10847 [Mobilisporobacter senegalensis]
MKRYVLYILLMISLFILTSCNGNENLAADDIKVNTVLIKGNGGIQSAMVGDFDKSYYSEEEFKNFVDEEISEYNQTKTKDAVSMKFFEIKDNIARVILNFSNIENYALFNNVGAEYITTREAMDHENIPDEFVSAKDGTKVSKEEALIDEKCRVIILSEPLDIRVEGKVKYYANSVLLNDKAVQSTEGISVVVIKP